MWWREPRGSQSDFCRTCYELGIIEVLLFVYSQSCNLLSSQLDNYCLWNYPIFLPSIFYTCSINMQVQDKVNSCRVHFFMNQWTEYWKCIPAITLTLFTCMHCLHKDLLCLNGQIWFITDQVSCVTFQINHYNEDRDQIPSIRFPVLLYAEMKYEITENSLQLQWSVRQNMFNLKAFSLE